MTGLHLGLQVYEATLAVLLLGYCEDCRMNHGFPTMSPSLLIDTLQVHLPPPSQWTTCQS